MYSNKCIINVYVLMLKTPVFDPHTDFPNIDQQMAIQD